MAREGTSSVVEGEFYSVALFSYLNLKYFQAIHISPVSCMSFDGSSTLLATGGCDSTIKVWDIIKKYCTHNLKGHQGVIR
jgi:WD40 repeat protein